MIQSFVTYDVLNISKKARVEAKSASEILLTAKDGNHSVALVLDRGQLLRQLVRMDEHIGAQHPGFGYIDTIVWNGRKR